VAFFAWHHTIFRVAKAKQNKRMGLAITTRGKKDFHAMTLPRVESQPLPRV